MCNKSGRGGEEGRQFQLLEFMPMAQSRYTLGMKVQLMKSGGQVREREREIDFMVGVQVKHLMGKKGGCARHEYS